MRALLGVLLLATAVRGAKLSDCRVRALLPVEIYTDTIQKTCFGNAIQETGCSLKDTECICSSEVFAPLLQDCVATHCNTNEADGGHFPASNRYVADRDSGYETRKGLL